MSKEIKENIKFWEDEAQKHFKENDIWQAVGCQILADKLKENLEKCDKTHKK